MIKLSVIIPTRNRSKYLDLALNSIVQQTLDRKLFEVIIVDNGSTDNTKEICYKYRDKISNLKYIFEKNPGLHNGRHTGLFNSKGDILVYADDDIIAFPKWLESIMNSFVQNEDVVMVGGKILPKFEETPPRWLEKKWGANSSGHKIVAPLSILDFGEVIQDFNPLYVFGCNFSIRKKILLKIGGFHPDGMPKQLIMLRGDGESFVSQYVKQNKMRCLYNPEASVFHIVTKKRMTVDYFKERGFAQGISISYSQTRESNYYLKGKFGIFLSKLMQLLLLNIKTIIKIIINRFSKADYFFNLGVINGIAFHKIKILNNKDLLIWIRKINYFQEKSDKKFYNCNYD